MRLSTRALALGLLVATMTGQPLPTQADPAPGGAEAGDFRPADMALARAAAASLASLTREESGIWPGAPLATLPIVLHVPGRLALLFHYTPPFPDGFRPLPGLPQVGLMTGGATLPAGLTSHVPVGRSRATSVALGTAGSVAGDLELAVQGSFRSFQRGRGFYAANSNDLTVASVQDLALASIEQRWLAKALLATDDAARKQAARHFLTIRNERRRHVTAEQTAGEDTHEVSEGTATYVARQFRLASQTAYAQAGWAHGETLTTLAGSLAGDLGEPITPKAFARLRYANTGMAMGLLLDRLQPGWKRAMESGARLTDLLSKATDYAGDGHDRALSEALADMELPTALARAEKAVAEARDEDLRALAAFNRSPGRRIEVIMPRRLTSGQLRYREAITLPDRSRLLGPGSTVTIGDAQATITIRQPVLVKRQGGRWVLTFFGPEAETTATVNGRPFRLDGAAKGAIRLTSPTTSLTAANATVSVTGAGTVIEVE